MQRNIRAFYDVIKQKRLNIEFSRRLFCFCMEAAIRFELMYNGFADRCLTTWLCRQKKMERETGFEPATSTLARLHSTTELFPLISATYLTFSAWIVNPFLPKSGNV